MSKNSKLPQTFFQPDHMAGLIESSPDGIAVVDPQGRHVYANPAFYKMTGLSEEELIGHPPGPDNYWADEELEHIQAAFDRTLAQDFSDFVLTFKRKNGECFPCSVSTSCVEGQDGKATHFFATMKDLSSLRQMQQALQEREERLKDLTENMSSGVAVYEAVDDGADFMIKEVNRACEKIGSVDHREIIGRTVTEVFPGIYEMGLLDVFRRVWKTGQPESQAVTHYQDGRISQWVENYVYRLASGEVVAIYDNITEQKQALQGLEQKEQELKHMLKGMINAFVLFDSVFDKNGKFVSYRFVYINDAYEQITGVKNDEVRGKTVHEVWPGTEPTWIKAYGEVAVTGVPSSFEMYHDPTQKMYYCNVYRPADTPERFCVIFEDITERKRSEQALKQQKFYLEKAQEIGKMGSWSLDLIKNKLVWTEESYNIFGIAPGTNLTYEIFLSAVHPEDRAYVDQEWTSSLKNKLPYDIEHRLLVDGKTKWVREKAEIIYDKGKAISANGFTQDITASKEAESRLKVSENRYRRLFESAPVAMLEQDLIPVKQKIDLLMGKNKNFLSDLRTHPEKFLDVMSMVRFLDVNDQCLRLFEAEDRDKLLGSIDKIFLQQAVVSLSEPIVAFLKGEIYFEGETEVVTLKGNRRDVFFSVSRQDTPDWSGPSQVIVIDITERKQVEKAKVRLVRNVSHGLKTPIAMAQMGVNIYEKGVRTARVDVIQRAREIIADNLNRLQRDVERMLQMFTLDVQSFEVEHREEVDLQQDLDDICSVLNPMITHRDLVIVADVDPKVRKVFAIKRDMQLLLDNLLDNAVKFSSQGRVKVSLRSGKKQGIVLQIKDQGVGIDSKDIGKVFDKFFQVSPVSEGVGLGLSICREVAASYGGEIRITSPGKGRGMTVTVDLPRVKICSK